MDASKLAELLAAPFPPDRISWRVGSTTADKKRGMALAFVDARDCMQRLDEVCGMGWQCRYPHANGKTVCEVGIKVGGEWIWRADGAGDTDFEAEKGALSDAFKRACVRFGLARYLYDIASPWVAIEPAGKSYKIADGELPKLRALLTAARGNGHTASPSVSAAPAPQKAERIPIPRAPGSPRAHSQQWQGWANDLLAWIKVNTPTTAEQAAMEADVGACLDASEKLHTWLTDKLGEILDSKRKVA